MFDIYGFSSHDIMDYVDNHFADAKITGRYITSERYFTGTVPSAPYDEAWPWRQEVRPAGRNWGDSFWFFMYNEDFRDTSQSIIPTYSEFENFGAAPKYGHF